jgi:hypothetical protein
MDSESALPLLERTLARRDRCSATLRKKALFLVSQKRTSRAADILLNVVRTDPEPEIRSEAVFWLGQTRDERAVDLLADILAKETNEEVLDKAVFALSQHRSERASTMLRDIAQREGGSLKLREQAIFWIGQRRNPENVDLLINLYGRVSNRELKDKIIFSLWGTPHSTTTSRARCSPRGSSSRTTGASSTWARRWPGTCVTSTSCTATPGPSSAPSATRRDGGTATHSVRPRAITG